jgi:hypothetical protein
MPATDRFVNAVTFGAMGNVYELTGDLHGMFGWPERVAAVADVWERLPADERPHTVIFAVNYGVAGAVDFLGRRYGLPHATSLSETYWLWGLPKERIDTVLALGFSRKTLERIFDEVDMVRDVELVNVNPRSSPFHIAICRKPKEPLRDLWAGNRPW